MGSCCTCASKDVSRPGNIPNTPRRIAVVTPQTEPVEPNEDLEENKAIKDALDTCEGELKELITEPEAYFGTQVNKDPELWVKETEQGLLMKLRWECPCSPEAVLAFTQNTSIRTSWDPYLAECSDLSDPKANIKLTYELDNVRFIPSPRDLLYAGKTIPCDDGLLYVQVSAEIPEKPPVKGLVRAQLSIGGYHICPTASGSLVTLYSEMDFGGAVPKEAMIEACKKRRLGWVKAFNLGIAQFGPSG